MTKPHEETWEATKQGHVRDVAGGDLLRGEAWEGPPDIERARLAAQAPAMARLLLKLEWSGLVFGDSKTCPDCYCSRPDGSFGGHAAECELASVLRAAGVLEEP